MSVSERPAGSGAGRTFGPGLALAVLVVAVAGLTWTLLSAPRPAPHPPTDIPLSAEPTLADISARAIGDRRDA